MVVDVIPDGTDVIGCLFRERERLSNQPTAPLAQRVVEPFDMTGLAALLANGSMALGWQNGCIGLPEIRVADRTLTVDGRKRGPQPACRRFGSCSNRHTHNLASLAIDGQPNPFLAPLVANERPQLITFQNQAPLFAP
jgi:hypothetical protein